MSKINLQDFADPHRNPIQKPFRHEGRVYATDGRIAIVADEYDGETIEAKPSVVGIILSHLKTVPRNTVEFRVGKPDDFSLEIGKCPDCNGKGYVAVCKKCGGEGYWTCDCCGTEVECKKCNIDGQMPCEKGDKGAVECDWCQGRGTVESNAGIDFANNYLSAYHLLRLAALPNCVLRENPKKDDPLYFSCDGAEGIIMPIRKVGEK